jgi:hypothetical protein
VAVVVVLVVLLAVAADPLVVVAAEALVLPVVAVASVVTVVDAVVLVEDSLQGVHLAGGVEEASLVAVDEEVTERSSSLTVLLLASLDGHPGTRQACEIDNDS